MEGYIGGYIGGLIGGLDRRLNRRQDGLLNEICDEILKIRKILGKICNKTPRLIIWEITKIPKYKIMWVAKALPECQEILIIQSINILLSISNID